MGFGHAVALQTNNFLYFHGATMPAEILGQKGLIQLWDPLDPGISNPGRVPEMNVRIHNWKINHLLFPYHNPISRLHNGHGITIAIETIVLFFGGLIGTHNEFVACEG